MRAGKFVWIFFVIVFLLSVVLISSMGYLSPNDLSIDHYVVIRILMDGRLPDKADCFQCYHPKLYHIVSGIALYVFNKSNEYRKLVVIPQLVSSFASITALYFYWGVLKDFTDKRVRLIAFSLIALNPLLIGLGAETSNNSFCILFSTVTIYYLHMFHSTSNRKYFLPILVSSIMTLLSKGNGIVLFPVIVFVFLLKLSSFDKKRALLVIGSRSREGIGTNHLLAFIVFYLISMMSLGQGLHNLRGYGSVFVSNAQSYPLPYLFRETYFDRPGVTSVLDTYFTFRFLDLLKNPFLGHDKYGDLHRTSFFTSIYAQTHSVHHSNYPPWWRPKSYEYLPFYMDLVRFALILALFPTALFAVGLFMAINKGIKIRDVVYAKKELCFNIVFDVRGFLKSKTTLHLLIFLSYLLLIIGFSMYKRDFASMSVRYVAPSFASVIYLFAISLESFYKKFEKDKTILYFSYMLFFCLMTVYVLDITLLILRFSGNEKGFLGFLARLGVIRKPMQLPPRTC